MGPCSNTKWECVEAIKVTEEDCPSKCEGLIVGVRKDPVRRLHKVQTSVLRVSVIKTAVLSLNGCLCPELWPPVLDCNIRSRGLKSVKRGWQDLVEEYGDYKCANYSQLPFENGLSGSDESKYINDRLVNSLMTQVSNSTIIFNSFGFTSTPRPSLELQRKNLLL